MMSTTKASCSADSCPVTTASHFISSFRVHIEQLLQQVFREHSVGDPRLQEAMAYTLTNGGKRIRALLVYASAGAIGKDCDATTETPSPMQRPLPLNVPTPTV